MAGVLLGSIEPSRVTDPTVRQFVGRAAKLIQWEILQALSGERDPRSVPARLTTVSVTRRPGRPVPSVGMTVQRWVKTLPAARRATVLNVQLPKLIQSTEMRQASLEMGLDLRSPKPGIEQVDLKAQFNFLNARSARRLGIGIGSLFGGIESGNDDAIVPNRGMHFELMQVTCVDETDPELFGKDKIAVGGTAVDDKEASTNIAEFEVGEFDDGDVVSFAPPKVLKSFALDATYPKTFEVFVALAEKDAGGFGDFLNEMYDAIRAHVDIIITALGAAAGAAIGAGLGGTLGSLGGPLGAVIGILAGLILGALIGLIVGLLQDDVFEPQVATVLLPSANAAFDGGSLTSPTLSFTYADFGGQYRVKYRWRLER